MIQGVCNTSRIQLGTLFKAGDNTKIFIILLPYAFAKNTICAG
jgi:hypothetical protein